MDCRKFKQPFSLAIGMRQLLARFCSDNLSLLETGVLNQPIDWLGANLIAGLVFLFSFAMLELNDSP